MAELTTNQKSLVGYMTKSDQHSAHGFGLILTNPAPEIYFGELQKAGLFDPQYNPKPRPVEGGEGFFRIPYWTALTYLTRVAEIAGETHNAPLGEEVMGVLRAIVQHRDGDALVDNYHTYSELSKIIGSVPTSCVRMEDIDVAKAFLATRWGNSVIVPALDRAMQVFLASGVERDWEKAVRLLEHCTELRNANDSDRSLQSPTSIADSFWLEKLLEHNAKALGEKAKAPALECLRKRMRQLFDEEYISTHSWLRRAAIEEHEQNHDWDHVTNAFIDATRDALNAWLLTHPDSAREYVAGMLTDESQIVRRIAINATRVNWGSLEQMFADALSPALFDVGHLHEMYLLLHQRFGQFDCAIQMKVVEIISGLAEGQAEDTERMERAQYRQRNWLDAIKGLGNEAADAEYARLTAMFGPLREHPDLLSYHSTSWVGAGPSPYTQEELTAFADDGSLVERVESFASPEDRLRSSRKSLIDELSNAVQAQPEKFIWTLDVDPTRPTQYGLMQGFAKFIEASKGGDKVATLRLVLNALLPYLEKVVVDTSFWEEPAVETDNFEPNKNWIPAVVVETAKKLVSNDEIALIDGDFQFILRAVLAVKQNAEGVEISDDPMTAAINNARGVAVDALLQFILRRCRDADRTSGSHTETWLALQYTIDAEVSACIDGKHLESSTLFASYLSQLLYVDEAWVRANIDRLFPFAHPDNVVCAVAGLSFANATSSVYHVLQHADIPRRALQLDCIKASTRERLIERIALAYVWGDEPLESAVISDMFAAQRVEDLIELTSTISRWSSEKLKGEKVDRAKQLARSVTNFGLADPSTRKNLLAAASSFIGYVKSPTEDDMPWLLAVAPFAHISHGEDYFLEALEAMASDNALRTFALLEEFLRDYEFTHDFRERLQSIVRKLNASGLHPQALGLVERLVRSGGGHTWVKLYNELVGRTQPAPPTDK